MRAATDASVPGRCGGEGLNGREGCPKVVLGVRPADSLSALPHHLQQYATQGHGELGLLGRKSWQGEAQLGASEGFLRGRASL